MASPRWSLGRVASRTLLAYSPSPTIDPLMSTAPPPSPAALPDATGHFGPYGGVYVPETLIAALTQLNDEYRRAKNDPAFQRELDY